MEELINDLKNEARNLIENISKFAEGNKAAGLRARKSTLKLADLGKQFRKESVK